MSFQAVIAHKLFGALCCWAGGVLAGAAALGSLVVAAGDDVAITELAFSGRSPLEQLGWIARLGGLLSLGYLAALLSNPAEMRRPPGGFYRLSLVAWLPLAVELGVLASLVELLAPSLFAFGRVEPALAGLLIVLVAYLVSQAILGLALVAGIVELPRDARRWRQYAWLQAALLLPVGIVVAGIILVQPIREWQAERAWRQRGIEVAFRRGDVAELRVLDPALGDIELAAAARLALAVRRLDLSHSQVTDAGLAALEQNAVVRELLLADTKVAGRGLAALNCEKYLKHLDLSDTPAGDGALKYVVRFKQLERLILRGTPTTDADLVRLAKLPNLQALDLASTPITDAGLAALEPCQKLTLLDLSNTRITDAGLSRLKPLEQLRVLNLKNTRVTAHAIEEFCSARPNCQVVRE